MRVTIVMTCKCGVAFDRTPLGAWTKNCTCSNRTYLSNVKPLLADRITFKSLTGKEFVANTNGLYTYKDNLNKY